MEEDFVPRYDFFTLLVGFKAAQLDLVRLSIGIKALEVVKLLRVRHHRNERDAKLELLEVGHVSLVLCADQL